jgi:capsular polysaccharide biosynthesis protein
VIDDAILINSQHSSNYFHWYFDSLAKLEGLDYIEGGWSRFKFIVNQKPSIWQKESLKLLGIDDDKIIYTNKRPVMVNNLLMLSPRRVPFKFSKVNTEWLRKRLLSSFKISKKKAGRKIFINRKNTEGRCITNIDEAISVFQEHGFEVVFTHEFDMSERVGLFQNSRIIAGIHGAGMANMMWAQNPMILEIFSDKYQADLFALSGALGFNYCSLKGKIEKKGKSGYKNFHLDKDMLSDVLAHISGAN